MSWTDGDKMEAKLTRGLRPSIKMPPANCPHCGRVNDAAATTDDARPSPGAFSICIECGGIGVFTDDMQIRAATDDEIDMVMQDPEVKRITTATKMAIAERARRGQKP